MNKKETLNHFIYACIGLKKPSSSVETINIFLIHLICWSIFFYFPFILYKIDTINSTDTISDITGKFLLVSMFYTNYLLLVPRLLEKKRIGRYLLSILLGLLLLLAYRLVIEVNNKKSFQHITGSVYPIDERDSLPYKSIASNPNIILLDKTKSLSPTVSHVPFKENDSLLGLPKFILLFTILNTTSSALLLLLIGTCLRLTFSFLKTQEEKKILQNATLRAEVNLLKSQINPHFLLNVLNGIYALSLTKSDATPDAIAKLSEMLKYDLYDSSDKKISLSKEINYLESYIQLQRMRINGQVNIEYNCNIIPENLKIAPMILLTFVENAFKHGVSYQKKTDIQIRLTLEKRNLTFNISNPILKPVNWDSIESIGLKNVKRMLELLYPYKHTLSINTIDQRFTVILKITLADD